MNLSSGPSVLRGVSKPIPKLALEIRTSFRRKKNGGNANELGFSWGWCGDHIIVASPRRVVSRGYAFSTMPGPILKRCHSLVRCLKYRIIIYDGPIVSVLGSSTMHFGNGYTTLKWGFHIVYKLG